MSGLQLPQNLRSTKEGHHRPRKCCATQGGNLLDLSVATRACPNIAGHCARLSRRPPRSLGKTGTTVIRAVWWVTRAFARCVLCVVTRGTSSNFQNVRVSIATAALEKLVKLLEWSCIDPIRAVLWGVLSRVHPNCSILLKDTRLPVLLHFRCRGPYSRLCSPISLSVLDRNIGAKSKMLPPLYARACVRQYTMRLGSRLLWLCRRHGSLAISSRV